MTGTQLKMTGTNQQATATAHAADNNSDPELLTSPARKLPITEHLGSQPWRIPGSAIRNNLSVDDDVSPQTDRCLYWQATQFVYQGFIPS